MDYVVCPKYMTHTEETVGEGGPAVGEGAALKNH